MGVAPPSIDAAFGDKRSLYDQAVALYTARLDEGLDRDLGEPVVRDAVERLLHSAVDHFTADDHPPGCLVMGEPMLAPRRVITRDRIRDRLRHAVDDGELPSVAEADALSTYLDTVLTGLAAQARDGVSRDRLRRSVDVAMRAWRTDEPGP